MSHPGPSSAAGRPSPGERHPGQGTPAEQGAEEAGRRAQHGARHGHPAAEAPECRVHHQTYRLNAATLMS